MLKSSLRISSSVSGGKTAVGVPEARRIERFTRQPSGAEATFSVHDPASRGAGTITFCTPAMKVNRTVQVGKFRLGKG